jgi:hypothetical protein
VIVWGRLTSQRSPSVRMSLVTSCGQCTLGLRRQWLCTKTCAARRALACTAAPSSSPQVRAVQRTAAAAALLHAIHTLTLSCCMYYGDHSCSSGQGFRCRHVLCRSTSCMFDHTACCQIVCGSIAVPADTAHISVLHACCAAVLSVCLLIGNPLLVV